MEKPRTPIENALVRSTVRLLAGKRGQPPSSVGTGFYYKVQNASGELTKVFVVTNKHVVRDADEIQFVLPYAPALDDLDEAGQPKGRVDATIAWPLQGNLIQHPDPNIDLCAIDITGPISHILNAGNQLRCMIIDSGWLPEPEHKKLIRDIEHVLVIGYPRGLWDNHNNMPISRVGTTATHPLAAYQGRTNFLIDVAAFQGSSGSPVFTYEAPMFRTAKGAYTPGTKVQFVGVVWGVVEWSVEGEMKEIEIPSSLKKQVPVLTTSLNLAVALHAESVRAIDRLTFEKRPS